MSKWRDGVGRTFWLVTLLLLAACGERVSLGTAPAGGTFFTFGAALTNVINENRGDLPWRMVAESTGGSMENIRLLTRDSADRMHFAMSNSSITYFAVRGEGDWEHPHEVRTVMTLFPNVALFVTRADSGIRQITDLKDKRVYLGPEGAGFEYYVRPILEAHGMTLEDIRPVYAAQQAAVEYLGDGTVAAAMIGGGIPTASITQAAQNMDVYFVPFDDDAKVQLIRDYPFFEPATIPAGTYAGQDEPFEGLNVGSAHLITSAAMDEQMVYDFVRLIWEHRQELAQALPAPGPARAINEDNVGRDTGTPFHPGAIRFYREIGVWPEGGSDAASSDE